jgi:hypothetical protein
MAAGLNGRVARLEATLKPLTDHCRACGLHHVRPMSIARLRGVLRIQGGSEMMAPPVLLCVCDCCSSDPGDRWIGRLSHGLEPDEGAA